MQDENFVTLGGRITHTPGIYTTPNQGLIMAFGIAHHTNFPVSGSTMFMDVKVGGTTDRTKLEEFITRLPIGRKITVHNASIQIKKWQSETSDEPKIAYHLFCKLEQIYLQDLARPPAAQASQSLHKN